MTTEQLREIGAAWNRYVDITNADYPSQTDVDAAYPEGKRLMQTCLHAVPALLAHAAELQTLYEREYEHRQRVEAERDALREALKPFADYWTHKAPLMPSDRETSIVMRINDFDVTTADFKRAQQLTD